MAEHDDALLDEDLVTLPDIDEEDYEENESDSNSEKESFMHENQCNQIDIKVEDTNKDRCNDVLDLSIADSFEKFVEEESKVQGMEITNFDINQNQLYIKSNKFNSDYNDSKSIVNKLSENYVLKSAHTIEDTVLNNNMHMKLHKLHHEREVNVRDSLERDNRSNYFKFQRYNDTLSNVNQEFDMFPMSEEHYKIHESERYRSMNNHQTSLQSLDNFSLPQMMYNPSYNFKTLRPNCPEFASVSIPVNGLRPLDHEPFYNFSTYQPYFTNNHIMCTNHSNMHCPHIQGSLYSMNQNLPFNQTSSINQVFPANHILPDHPIMTMNQILPINRSLQTPMAVDVRESMFHNRNKQLFENQNKIPNYSLPYFPYKSIRENNNDSHNEINPLDGENRFGIHKILVNRDFRKNQTEREVKMIHNAAEYQEFLHRNRYTAVYNNENGKPYQTIKNYDPYSYFSDIWQEKRAQDCNRNYRDSFYPEIIFSKTPSMKDGYEFEYMKHKQEFQNDRRNFEPDQANELFFRPRREETDIFSSNDKISNSRNLKTNNVKNRKQKRKQRGRIQQRLGAKVDSSNSNKSSVNCKKQKLETQHTPPKKEEDMDPEIEEYYKKIDEQKLRRQIFLREKEERRKLLAMQKLETNTEHC